MQIDSEKHGKRTVKHAFGLVLRAIRLEQSLTQEQLAEKLNVSNVHISNLENGKSHPSLEKAINIAEALGVSPGALIEAVAQRIRDLRGE